MNQNFQEVKNMNLETKIYFKMIYTKSMMFIQLQIELLSILIHTRTHALIEVLKTKMEATFLIVRFALLITFKDNSQQTMISRCRIFKILIRNCRKCNKIKIKMNKSTKKFYIKDQAV
jgi:hypothetical protein